MTKRIAALTGILVALVLAVAGCGGSTASKAPTGDRLAAAKKAIDKTSGLKIKLSAKLPENVSGVLSAEGTANHQPAFDGKITVFDKNIPLTLPAIAVDGKVYIKFGIWSAVDPSKYNAPDPAALMSPSNGLSSLLTSATHVSKGSDERDGKTTVTTYSATVPGSVMGSIIPSASATKDFDAKFSLDGKDHLVKATLTGAFYPNAKDLTYTFTFSDYGTSATIKKP